MGPSLFLLLLAHSIAGTVYMDPAGSVAAGCGGSLEEACGDWPSAALAVNALAKWGGTVLVLAPGEYVINVSAVTAPALFAYPVDIESSPGAVVTLAGYVFSWTRQVTSYIQLAAGGSIAGVTFQSRLNEGSGYAAVVQAGLEYPQLCPVDLVPKLSFTMTGCVVRDFKEALSVTWVLPIVVLSDHCYNQSSLVVRNTSFAASVVLDSVGAYVRSGSFVAQIVDNKFLFSPTRLHSSAAVGIYFHSPGLVGKSAVIVRGNTVAGTGLLDGGAMNYGTPFQLLANASMSLDVRDNAVVDGKLVNWVLPLYAVDERGFQGTQTFGTIIASNTVSCRGGCNAPVAGVENLFAPHRGWPIPTVEVSGLNISGSIMRGAVVVRGPSKGSNGGVPGVVSISDVAVDMSSDSTGAVFDLDPRHTLLVRNIRVTTAGSAHIFRFFNALYNFGLEGFYTPSLAIIENITIRSNPATDIPFHIFNVRNGWLMPVIPWRASFRGVVLNAVRLTDDMFNLAFPSNLTFRDSVLVVEEPSLAGLIACWNASLSIDPSCNVSLPPGTGKNGLVTSCWQCVLEGVPSASSCLYSTWWLLGVGLPCSLVAVALVAVVFGCCWYRRRKRATYVRLGDQARSVNAE